MVYGMLTSAPALGSVSAFVNRFACEMRTADGRTTPAPQADAANFRRSDTKTRLWNMRANVPERLNISDAPVVY